MSVDDIDEYSRGLATADLGLEVRVSDRVSGGREFKLTDPDGHIIVIFQKK